MANLNKMTNKEKLLFDCCKLLLEDGCPKEPKEYLCILSEDYDNTSCKRCWEEYLYRIINL